MMQLIKVTLLCLLVMALSVSCQKQPETAATVLQKVIAAHGAEPALNEVQGLLFHGHIQSLNENDHGKLWILYRHPDQLRVIGELTNKKEDRLYLRGEGWIDNGSGFTRATGLALDLMKFQSEHLSLFSGLLAGKYQLRLIGEIRADQPVEMALTDADGLETKITIDPVNWLVRAVERALVVDGEKVSFGIAYEEYRRVKGVQLPFRILNLVNGQLIIQADFGSVQTNPSLPENVFSTPDLKAKKDGKSSA
jgi:hypothetical protein